MKKQIKTKAVRVAVQKACIQHVQNRCSVLASYEEEIEALDDKDTETKDGHNKNNENKTKILPKVEEISVEEMNRHINEHKAKDRERKESIPISNITEDTSAQISKEETESEEENEIDDGRFYEEESDEESGMHEDEEHSLNEICDLCVQLKVSKEREQTIMKQCDEFKEKATNAEKRYLHKIQQMGKALKEVTSHEDKEKAWLKEKWEYEKKG